VLNNAAVTDRRACRLSLGSARSRNHWGFGRSRRRRNQIIVRRAGKPRASTSERPVLSVTHRHRLIDRMPIRACDGGRSGGPMRRRRPRQVYVRPTAASTTFGCWQRNDRRSQRQVRTGRINAGHAQAAGLVSNMASLPRQAAAPHSVYQNQRSPVAARRRRDGPPQRRWPQ
jgi:hypothetical protein